MTPRRTAKTRPTPILVYSPGCPYSKQESGARSAIIVWAGRCASVPPVRGSRQHSGPPTSHLAASLSTLRQLQVAQDAALLSEAT
jgi:hypothetical protein